VNIATEEVVAIDDPLDRMFRDFFDPYWRRRPPNTQYSLGSGVIIEEEGYVLTNFHVVGRATRVWVILSDGRLLEAEKITGSRSTDVALIRIRTKNNEKFAPVKFAADDDLLLGETVLAMGNPFGLGASVSRGILSSRSRRPPTEDQPLDIPDWLQTDASINPGNSGGPLINLKGELIGINVAVLNQAQGIGFAIPIKRVAQMISEMFSPEGLDSIWFGARARPGSAPLVIASVEPESPADLAGLRPGDSVLKVGGREPKNFIDFVGELRKAGTRKDVTLVTQRGRAQHTVTVRQIPETTFFNIELIRRRTGVTMTELTPDLARRLGLRDTDGLYVESVERGSAAEAAKLQRGMIVTAIDSQGIESVIKIARRLHGKARNEKVRLDLLVPVQRRGFYGFSQSAVELALR
jgi:serine protease Do